MAGSSSGKQHVFQAPRGTRDFYPAEMLRRRWIEEAWRRTAIRHGFEEIDGPRFEHADLYTVKSGEGILSELFSFKRWAPGEGPLHASAGRAGSSPSRSTPIEEQTHAHGDRAGDGPAREDEGAGTWYALRPEFTPTLARMVAARAPSLPRPIKWFSVGPYFRAERPQRGRLREFLQWNVDLLGSAEDDEETKVLQDIEVITCCIESLRMAGLTPDDVCVRFSSRALIENRLRSQGVPEERFVDVFALLDSLQKIDASEAAARAEAVGIGGEEGLRNLFGYGYIDPEGRGGVLAADVGQFLGPILETCQDYAVEGWLKFDPLIVRGLAYYTGMVFEVHEVSGKERAIAGGGRYDKLVELFGGPPTPAVGFAMGDVVLANVLQDKGLMPSDAQLAAELGLRPDVFVISTGDEASEDALLGVVAGLRQAGLHARHTYKSTRNVGKLLKEAASSGARFAAILENAETCALKNLDTGEQTEGVAVATLAETVNAQRAT